METNQRQAPRVAVVGVGGIVGSQLVELIRERSFSVKALGLFGSSTRDAADLDGQDTPPHMERLENFAALAGFDLAFLAVPAELASEIAAARPGPALIDLSGVSQSGPEGALVGPGFTARERFDTLQASGAVFAIPHPMAFVTATILRALGAETGLISAVGMLGASSFGKRCAHQIIDQSVAALNGNLDLKEDQPQLAFNLFLARERDMMAQALSGQVAALVGKAPQLAIQLARVPIPHGAALSLCIPTVQGVGDWRERLRDAPGVLLEEEEPAALAEVVSQEAIVVSVREQPGAWLVWCAFDSARVAALGALWVAENLTFTGGAKS